MTTPTVLSLSHTHSYRTLSHTLRRTIVAFTHALLCNENLRVAARRGKAKALSTVMIVIPVSTLENWKSEYTRWGKGLKVPCPQSGEREWAGQVGAGLSQDSAIAPSAAGNKEHVGCALSLCAADARASLSASLPPPLSRALSL